jgi:hypothetical protein
MKKPKTITEKPAPKVKVEHPIVNLATKAMPNQVNPDKKIPKKTKVVALKPVTATPEMTISERVGMTAGSIWHYLTENGATPVAKLLRELTEEEKIIQRSIGWLAQEDKITLDVIGRVEIIALKE